jgi:hypothetical protein
VGLADHGILFWNDSRDTLVERNLVVNNARGIGFGLGDRGHQNGMIRNNFVVATDPRLFASGAGLEVGIGVESAQNVKVIHNTVASTEPFTSIEWRFPPTTATITNNLVTHGLRNRNEGTAALAGNVTSAPVSLFIDIRAADLRLRPEAVQAIDRGVSVPAGDADDDIEGDSRLGGARDVGADEVAAAPTTPSVPTAPSGPSTPSGASTPTAPTTPTAPSTPTTPSTPSGASTPTTPTTPPAPRAPSGPTITRQPADRVVRVGTQATFRVEAEGNGTLRYQWRRNGANISGATGRRYTTPVLSRRDSGARLECIVSDTRGTVKSRAAKLLVWRGR